MQKQDEASLQEQRRELRALLLQDLANFRQGHGYLMAKELEEKVAALRLSKSVLHRVKILHYLRLRERHSGSLHPALLAANPDTLPPRRSPHLRRPRARVMMLPGDSPQERSLPPIPEEDTVEEAQNQEHPAQRRHLGVAATRAEECRHGAMPLEAPPAEAARHGSDAPDAPPVNHASPYPAGHERPSLKRRFLKKNEKTLPQGLPAPLDKTTDSPLRVSSISHQYLALDRPEAAEPHGGSLGKMVLKIEINCMSPWADVAQLPSNSIEAPGGPSAPAGGRHTTVTDIVLDAASSPLPACPASRPAPTSLKEASVLASSPPQGSPACPGPSAAPAPPLSPEVVYQLSDASISQVSPPGSVHEPAGDGQASQPCPLSSGPTDYLTWAAEVTREEDSRLGSQPRTPA